MSTPFYPRKAQRSRAWPQPVVVVFSLSLSKKPDKIDSDVAARLRYITIRLFLVFCVRFSCSHFHKVLVRYRYRDSLSLSILSGFFDSE